MRPMSTAASDHQGFADALFESIAMGAITTDKQGRITRINAAALEMLGRTEAEMLGQPFTRQVVSVTERGRRLTKATRPIVRALANGETVDTRAHYKHSDGHIVPVSLSVSPVMVNGKQVGAIQMFRDTSLEDEIDHMKSDFISLASHQLRTPLSAIQTYTHLIMEGYMGPTTDPQKEALRTILTATARMNELVSTLLSITRIEGGNVAVAPKTTDLTTLAKEVLKEYSLEADEHDITLSLKAPKNLPVIRTDPLLFKEVLSNIISNALKYTSAKGSVTVNIRNRTHDVLFSVADTGLGIPKNAQGLVFAKFFRADNVIQRETNGTGLGLYLVKGLVDALGGHIWFESVENQGTTFYITLPKD